MNGFDGNHDNRGNGGPGGQAFAARQNPSGGAAMDPGEFRKLMEEIRQSNAGQEKYARRQYRMSQITAIASVLVLVVVCAVCLFLVPKVIDTYQNMQVILEDVKVITGDLAEVDIDQMVGDVDKLVVTSEKNINSAMEKIEEIDIEGLNQAIRNLSDAVEPLANLFNRFR